MKSRPAEQHLLKEILSGKYRECYLMYNRRSTDEPDNQKNSLRYQKKENGLFIKREKIKIAPITLKGFCTDGVISEKHSGFKEDDFFDITSGGIVQYKIERPKFHHLLWLLGKQCFKGIVCLCWDRISRNDGDDTALEKLMNKGIDIRFTFARYEKTSSGALHMDIDKMFAKHHSRVTSEKITIAGRLIRDEGLVNYRAPIGYLNLGTIDHKPFDPERAPIIKEMFERYATGKWSYAALARWANDQGLTTLPMRRPRTKEELLDDDDDESFKTKIPQKSRPIRFGHIGKILSNPFYTGKTLDSNNVYIPSKSHKALVSEELFQKVQEARKRRKVCVQYNMRLKQPLRGMIRCGECNRAFCPYMKKGHQYFGLRCKPGCTNPIKSINLNFIEKEVGKLISGLHFTKRELEELDIRANIDIDALERKRMKELEEDERKKKKIREDLTYLNNEKLMLLKMGVYTPESYMVEEEKLKQKLRSLKTNEDASDEAMSETMKDVLRLSELLHHVDKAYFWANSEEKEEFIRIIFSELFVFDNTLKYKCHSGFQCLENRFEALGDPNTWLSELFWQRDEIQIAIKKLERVLKYRDLRNDSRGPENEGT